MFLRAKKYNAAVTSLNYSISLRPNYGDAFTYRGLAREGQIDHQTAITDYETAVNYGTTVNCTQKQISQLRAAK
jgi:regulator of sirC expression with transglutaminase-like and TPR domain